MTVTSDDFEAFVLRVPEFNRAEARSSYEWIGKATDLIYENRVLAAEARRLGYEKDPKVALRMKQVEESYLAQLWAERYAREYPVPDLTVRARELYRVNRDKYTVPERVTGSQILISFRKRTPEMARDIAQSVYERARAGASFADLAVQFSEDPGFAANKGRFYGKKQSDFEELLGQAVFAVAPGEIAVPIETFHGFHIVKVEKKEAGRTAPFEEVQESIVMAEADRIRNNAREQELVRLKNVPQMVVNTKNIEALRVEIPKGLTEQVHRDAAQQLKAPATAVPPSR